MALGKKKYKIDNQLIGGAAFFEANLAVKQQENNKCQDKSRIRLVNAIQVLMIEYFFDVHNISFTF